MNDVPADLAPAPDASAPLPSASVPSVPDSTALNPTVPFTGPVGCRAREILDLVANKWSLSVVDTLGGGPMRFGEIKRAISGISQRMLTVTLRGLERDGLLTRTVYAVMPPNVTHELTSMGRVLLEATRPLVRWSLENIAAVDTARAEFDARAGQATAK